MGCASTLIYWDLHNYTDMFWGLAAKLPQQTPHQAHTTQTSNLSQMQYVCTFSDKATIMQQADYSLTIIAICYYEGRLCDSTAVQGATNRSIFLHKFVTHLWA